MNNLRQEQEAARVTQERAAAARAAQQQSAAATTQRKCVRASLRRTASRDESRFCRAYRADGSSGSDAASGVNCASGASSSPAAASGRKAAAAQARNLIQRRAACKGSLSTCPQAPALVRTLFCINSVLVRRIESSGILLDLCIAISSTQCMVILTAARSEAAIRRNFIVCLSGKILAVPNWAISTVGQTARELSILLTFNFEVYFARISGAVVAG